MSLHNDDDESIDSELGNSLHDFLGRPDISVTTRSQSALRNSQMNNGSATAQFNIFSTAGPSSSANQDDPNPQVEIPDITNTTSSSSRTGGSIPAARANSNISPQTFTFAQVTELFRQFSAQNNNVAPAAQPVAPIVLKQIPQSEFKDTTTAQSKSMESMKFSNNSNANRETLKALNTLLNECMLFTLVQGTRPAPVFSTYNTFGYTPDSVRKVGAEIIMTPRDDLFKYAHDQARLFTVMHTVTAKDLLYLVPDALTSRDGVAWYKAIVDHVHGTTNTDIRKAKCQ